MIMRGATALALVGLLALGACASDDLEARLAEAERQNTDLVMETEQFKRELADQVAAAEAAAAELARREREAAAEKRNAAEAAKRAHEYAAELEKAAAERQRLEAELAARGDSITEEELMRRLEEQAEEFRRRGHGDVAITRDGNIEITLHSDVTFGSGKHALTSGGKKSIDGLRSLLQGTYSDYDLRVVGHTDSTPLRRTKKQYGTNRTLGHYRAESVVNYLSSSLGVDPKRMISASLGEHSPVAANNSKSGQAKNRRVEIVVVIPRQDVVETAQAK